MRFEVILDAGETANKCTIAPLAYRPDFRLIPVLSGGGTLGPLTVPILLHHEGECLLAVRERLAEPGRAGESGQDRFSKVSGIACVDCIWRRLDPLLSRIASERPLLRARIPNGFVTAYPRRGSEATDPDGGLATIEAIFTAAALLGNWDPTLFSEYYFGRRFVELNARRFLELGVAQAGDEKQYPVLNHRRPRNALQRRQDRDPKWPFFTQ